MRLMNLVMAFATVNADILRLSIPIVTPISGFGEETGASILADR